MTPQHKRRRPRSKCRRKTTSDPHHQALQGVSQLRRQREQTIIDSDCDSTSLPSSVCEDFVSNLAHSEEEQEEDMEHFTAAHPNGTVPPSMNEEDCTARPAVAADNHGKHAGDVSVAIDKVDGGGAITPASSSKKPIFSVSPHATTPSLLSALQCPLSSPDDATPSLLDTFTNLQVGVSAIHCRTTPPRPPPVALPSTASTPTLCTKTSPTDIPPHPSSTPVRTAPAAAASSRHRKPLPSKRATRYQHSHHPQRRGQSSAHTARSSPKAAGKPVAVAISRFLEVDYADRAFLQALAVYDTLSRDPKKHHICLPTHNPRIRLVIHRAATYPLLATTKSRNSGNRRRVHVWMGERAKNKSVHVSRSNFSDAVVNLVTDTFRSAFSGGKYVPPKKADAVQMYQMMVYDVEAIESGRLRGHEFGRKTLRERLVKQGDCRQHDASHSAAASPSAGDVTNTAAITAVNTGTSVGANDTGVSDGVGDIDSANPTKKSEVGDSSASMADGSRATTVPTVVGVRTLDGDFSLYDHGKGSNGGIANGASKDDAATTMTPSPGKKGNVISGRRPRGRNGIYRGGGTGATDVAKRLDDRNKGFGLLSRLGWREGEGLGVENDGRKEPLNAGRRTGRNGVGR